MGFVKRLLLWLVWWAIGEIATIFIRHCLWGVTMPFTAPSFPSTCNILDGVTLAIRHAGVPCHLHFLDRVKQTVPFYDAGTYPAGSTFYFPARTDVRDFTDQPITHSPDVIELPPGSGSYYSVFWVGDMWRDSPNEYRVAMGYHVSRSTAVGRP